MGFPTGVQTIVLTGRVGSADGAADRDPITITPSPERIVSGAYDFIVEHKPVEVTPDRATGSWAVRLLATDAASINPTGWTYQVQIGDSAPFFIQLPTSLGDTADLSDLVVVSEDPGTYDVLLPASELGGAAFLDVGSTEGTVAAGNDSRFAANGGGALLAGNDLSDLHSAVTARSNLGLGSAATQATTAFDAAGSASSAQTAAAADATTKANAAQAAAEAYADAGDTTTLVAAKAYTDAHSGGGSGAVIRSQGDDRIDLEIVVLTNSASWAVVRTSGGVAIGKSVRAAAGDRVLVSPSFMYTGTQYELDLAVMASNGTSISRYAGSSGSGTSPGAEGYPPLYTQATSFPHAIGPIMFTVAAGEVDGTGHFTVNLAYHAPSLSGVDQKIYAGSGYIARWVMLNIGPEPA